MGLSKALPIIGGGILFGWLYGAACRPGTPEEELRAIPAPIIPLPPRVVETEQTAVVALEGTVAFMGLGEAAGTWGCRVQHVVSPTPEDRWSTIVLQEDGSYSLVVGCGLAFDCKVYDSMQQEEDGTLWYVGYCYSSRYRFRQLQQVTLRRVPDKPDELDIIVGDRIAHVTRPGRE